MLIIFVREWFLVGCLIFFLYFSRFVRIFEREATGLTPSWSRSVSVASGSEVYQELNLFPVYGNNSSPVIFRLWMNPSWGENTVITAFMSDKGSFIDVKQFVFNEDTFSREITNVFSKKLDIDETRNLVGKIKESRFLWEEPDQRENYGLDGWTWHIEANVHGSYLQDEAWPQTVGPLFVVGDALIKASGLQIKCYSGGC
jgi:hypothetical protein